MKYMIDYPISSTADGGVWIKPENVSRFAMTLESMGVDAIGFTDHPAPSRKWLEGGGHESFDPFVALAYCAAVTARIGLMTHLAVVPYRNPFLQAKSMTTVDVLSGGRSIFVLGSGYLRSEFAALGVDFDERNQLFDESIKAMKGIWSTEALTFSGREFTSIDQVMRPNSLQRPHPPLWIGGNSVKARNRLADWGDGWAALVGPVQMTTTSRTPSITGPEQLQRVIRDIDARLNVRGRSLEDIEIMSSSPGADLSIDMPRDQRIEYLVEMASIGVSWIQLTVHRETFNRCIESIGDFMSGVATEVP